MLAWFFMSHPMAIAFLLHRRPSSFTSAALACMKAYRYATEQKQ
jgi:hypothetical protein